MTVVPRQITPASGLTLCDKITILAGGPRLPPQGHRSVVTGHARTCIDAGGDMLVTLQPGSAPGLSLAAGLTGTGNARLWDRRLLSQCNTTGASLLFGRPTLDDFVQACTFCDAPLPRTVTRLREFGHVYMATRNEPETRENWLAFMLHPRQPLRPVLAALGAPDVWPQLRHRMGALFGRAVSDTLRPWSVAISLTSGALRIGTTAWSRLPEDAAKAQAFGRLFDALQGDGPQAAAIYNLIARHAAASTQTHGRPPRTGVAAEFQFLNGQACGAVFTLRLPSQPTAI